MHYISIVTQSLTNYIAVSVEESVKVRPLGNSCDLILLQNLVLHFLSITCQILEVGSVANVSERKIAEVKTVGSFGN